MRFLSLCPALAEMMDSWQPDDAAVVAWNGETIRRALRDYHERGVPLPAWVSPEVAALASDGPKLRRVTDAGAAEAGGPGGPF
jgi:hypothetical protein